LSGASKLDAQVMWEFAYLLGQKTARRMFPPLADRQMAKF
jgi:hypothetical protein